MELHDFLDWNYGPDGDEVLRRMLDGGGRALGSATARARQPQESSE